jgi:hypothetical protein
MISSRAVRNALGPVAAVSGAGWLRRVKNPPSRLRGPVIIAAALVPLLLCLLLSGVRDAIENTNAALTSEANR